MKTPLSAHAHSWRLQLSHSPVFDPPGGRTIFKGRPASRPLRSAAARRSGQGRLSESMPPAERVALRRPSTVTFPALIDGHSTTIVERADDGPLRCSAPPSSGGRVKGRLRLSVLDPTCARRPIRGRRDAGRPLKSSTSGEGRTQGCHLGWLVRHAGRLDRRSLAEDGLCAAYGAAGPSGAVIGRASFQRYGNVFGVTETSVVNLNG